jgi:methionine-rich copper-binding protein CopC
LSFQEDIMSRTIRITALGAAMALALTGTALAHAHLKASTPAGGSTLSAPPAEIDLTFSEAVNLKFTGIAVAGPDKKAVATGEGMLMDNGMALMVPLSGTLGAGAYAVEWHALSRDGHKTSGSFTFTVKP